MTDYQALMARWREIPMDEVFNLQNAGDDLADAVEALVAEGDDLADGVERLAGFNESLKGDLAAMTRERDALQQQLDTDNFESMRSRITALEAVIERVRESREYDGPMKPYRYDSQAVTNLLDMAPSVVLDGMIREAKAEAEAENEKLRQVARAAVRRLEKAAQYCGDPQHPIWDGGRTSEKARQRVESLLDILDPFRPELEDASDEEWDRIYNLDPIDAYVSDYEERVAAERDALRAENADLKEDEQEALAERNAALKQRDALRAQLDGMTTEWGVKITVPNGWWIEQMRSREECEHWIANPPLRYTHQVGESFAITTRVAASPWMEVTA